MLLRALFWITVVALLIPHEPDLGFGRPGAHEDIARSAAAWAQTSLAAPNNLCKDEASTCTSALGVLASFRSIAVQSLAQVRADIEAQQHERALGLKS